MKIFIFTFILLILFNICDYYISFSLTEKEFNYNRNLNEKSNDTNIDIIYLNKKCGNNSPPINILDCNYYSKKNNSCCFYKYSLNTGCFYLGGYYQGTKEYKGLFVECSLFTISLNSILTGILIVILFNY